MELATTNDNLPGVAHGHLWKDWLHLNTMTVDEKIQKEQKKTKKNN
jgi:hypothetical protein